jgi:hypothetical protein
MTELEALRAENKRLTELNAGLAKQVLGVADRLEAGRRDLLATGWDAGFATGKSRAMRMMSDEPTLSLNVENPYRKPVPDFSGAIICRTNDDE